tara:strand:- start:1546 stop:2214 length:669 start_codon:yes stop_codon:yes gene_type:complete
MDSGKTLKHLIEQLYRPLLFFFPKSIIPDSEKSKFEGINSDDFFNTPVLISTNGTIDKINSIKNYGSVLEKASILNYNLLKLLDAKEDLGALQFQTLLENYILHLRFYVFITKWMNEHFNYHCEINKSLKSYFQLQQDYFNHHKLAVETKFKLKTITDLSSKEVLTYFENDTPPLLKNIIKTDKFLKKNNSIKIANDKKKTVLITDQESRNFLLDNVFNLHN